MYNNDGHSSLVRKPYWAVYALIGVYIYTHIDIHTGTRLHRHGALEASCLNQSPPGHPSRLRHQSPPHHSCRCQSLGWNPSRKNRQNRWSCCRLSVRLSLMSRLSLATKPCSSHPCQKGSIVACSFCMYDVVQVLGQHLITAHTIPWVTWGHARLCQHVAVEARDGVLWVYYACTVKHSATQLESRVEWSHHLWNITCIFSHTNIWAADTKTVIQLRGRVRYSPSASNDDLCNRHSKVRIQQQHRAVYSHTCMCPHHEGHHKVLYWFAGSLSHVLCAIKEWFGRLWTSLAFIHRNRLLK
jgi:hypothetical protein